MPSAMGRSEAPDSLAGRLGGAGFAVSAGSESMPAFWMAARPRSRAPLTSVSGWPQGV